MRSRIAMLLVCLSLLLAIPAYAIFGLGDIVFDPTNYANAIQQLIQAEQQVSQLVRTYQTVRSQWEHMIRMAQRLPFDTWNRYRSPLTPLRQSSSTNLYGTSGGWISGINTGVGVENGYRAASQALAAYGSAIAQLPGSQAARVKSGYATVELTDSANIYSLQTIGDLRGRAALLDTAIRNLEADSLSADPALNTEIAVLNKINAANVLAVRNTQDSNRLLIALAEEQVVAAKRQRDAEATAINHHIQFINEGRSILTAQTANASEAMRSWRLP